MYEDKRLKKKELVERRPRMKKSKQMRIASLMLVLLLGLTACTKPEVPVTTEGATTEPAMNSSTEQESLEEESLEEEITYDGQAIYAEKLDEICNALENPDEYDLFEMEGMIGLAEIAYQSEGGKALGQVGYMIGSLNKDKVPELIIAYIDVPGDKEVYGRNLYSVYTYVDGEVVCVLEGSARNSYYWTKEGQFFNSGSGGAMYHGTALYDFPENADSLQCAECYFTHERNGDLEDIAVYYNTTGSWNVDESEETDMLVDDLFAKEEEIIEEAIYLELIPLAQYAGVETNDSDALDAVREKIGEDAFCGVAFLGYWPMEYADLMQNMDRLGYTEEYPFLSEISSDEQILAEGGEWYLIVPSADDIMITVSEAVMDESDYTLKEGELLYEGTGEKPILMRGNVSEIMPNLIITMQKANGEVCKYSPALSMLDSGIQVSEGVIDITCYGCLEN